MAALRSRAGFGWFAGGAMLTCFIAFGGEFFRPMVIAAVAMFVIGAWQAWRPRLKRDPYDLGALRDLEEQEELRRAMEEAAPPEDPDTVTCPFCLREYSVRFPVCPHCRRS